MSAERVRFVIFNRSVCFRVFETNGLQIYTTAINYATEHDHRFVWTSIELLEPPSRLCWVLDISVAFSLARRMFLLKLKLLEEICQWSLSSVHKRSDRGVSCSFWGRHASIKSVSWSSCAQLCSLNNSFKINKFGLNLLSAVGLPTTEDKTFLDSNDDRVSSRTIKCLGDLSGALTLRILTWQSLQKQILPCITWGLVNFLDDRSIHVQFSKLM